ncbi:hypothetical protein KC19_VG002800, partial [Ceratodon purpureus]
MAPSISGIANRRTWGRYTNCTVKWLTESGTTILSRRRKESCRWNIFASRAVRFTLIISSTQIYLTRKLLTRQSHESIVEIGKNTAAFRFSAKLSHSFQILREYPR